MTEAPTIDHGIQTINEHVDKHDELCFEEKWVPFEPTEQELEWLNDLRTDESYLKAMKE